MPRQALPALLSLTFGAALIAAPSHAAPPARGADSSAPADEAEDAGDTADPIFPYPWQEKQLDNGLRVVVIPMPTPGLVSYRTVVRTGARDEYEKGVTGFAHFFEHMMFRGTKKYPSDKYNEIVTRMGADANAYTSTDMTVYEFDIAKEDLETVAEIESDRFMNLAYEESGFKTEAGAVYGEYRKNKSSPFFVLYEAMRETAYTRHTYAHTTIGFEADIAAMPRQYEYSLGFFDRYYRPENCVVVIAGDVEVESSFALVERYYGSWERGYVAPKIKPEPKQRKPKYKEVEYEGKTKPRVWIGYKGGAFAPDDRIWVASLVLAELAFGDTSDIYRELMLEQQLVESLQAGGADSRDPGLWSIIATIKNEGDVQTVIERIERTVVRFREQPPDPAKLGAVKSHMRYDYLLGLDTSAAVAGEVAGFIGTAGDLASIETLYRNLGAITPEDVQTAAKRWLVDNGRTTVVLREAKTGGPQ